MAPKKVLARLLRAEALNAGVDLDILGTGCRAIPLLQFWSTIFQMQPSSLKVETTLAPSFQMELSVAGESMVTA